MNCIDYGSDALNKVYGGMNCQDHPTDLPYTGSELFWYVCIGVLILCTGYCLRKEREK